MAIIDRIKLPDGVTYDIQDTISGYTTNTGTVTSVVGGTGLNGGTITSSGTLSVKYGTSANTACEGNDTRLSDSRPSSDVVQTYSSTSTVPISGKGVAAALATLPSPMVFKGTLGTGGTITALPVNGTATIGDTYKVITAGTYASQVAKIGDVFICQTKTSSANTWAYVPSGDDTVADTWRNIKVNGTEKLGTGISSGAVDFVNGTNTTVSYNATGNKISISATDTNDAVTQTATSTNSNYEVLFSGTADNTTRTEGARKYSNFTFNPSSGTVTATKFVGDISGCTGGTDVHPVDICVTYANDAFEATYAYEAGFIKWENVQSKPTTLAGYGITDAVSTIAYDTTNKKFTKTINGTTTNVAILATTSVGSASAGTAIPADDITAWTTNTPTEVTPNTVVTGGTTTNIPNITKKTVVTGVTKKTVVTGCTPATVVTSASGATASVSGCTLTITDGSFSTGASASVTTGDSCTVTTGDSVTVGTPIAAYTSLTTGDACSVTAGTAASLSYTAKSIPNISVSSKTVATGFTTS